MGLILWLVYSNDMPSLKNNQCRREGRQRHERYLFGNYCKECGMRTGYADDLQFIISGKYDEESIVLCNRVLELWISYCNRNSLCINEKKTILQKLMSRRKLQTKPVETIHLNQCNEQGEWIYPMESHKLLGIRLKNDLSWRMIYNIEKRQSLRL